MDIESRIQEQSAQLEAQWAQDERWAGIERTYTAEDVVRLRGSLVPECTLGRVGSERLWRLLTAGGYTNALIPGAMGCWNDAASSISASCGCCRSCRGEC